jgi:hypothetical protein
MMRAEEEDGMRFFGFSCKSNLLQTKEVVGFGWTKEGACGGVKVLRAFVRLFS